MRGLALSVVPFLLPALIISLIICEGCGPGSLCPWCCNGANLRDIWQKVSMCISGMGIWEETNKAGSIRVMRVVHVSVGAKEAGEEVCLAEAGHGEDGKQKQRSKGKSFRVLRH